MNPLLLRRRGMMMAQQGGLPYDAEIEYLESDGTQYIDLGYIGNLNTSIEIVIVPKNTQCTYGCRGNNTNDITVFTNPNGGLCRFGNKSYNANITLNTSHTIKQSKAAIVIDGTSHAYNATVSFNTPNTLLLFCLRYNNLPDYYWKGQVFSFSITENSTTIIDFIPVRVGQVGYMYDRVSGQLFGNSGTGDFILGPDIQ